MLRTAVYVRKYASSEWCMQYGLIYVHIRKLYKANKK